MLAHRLATGFTLVVIFVAVLALDEAMAPWFPFWFVLASIVMASSALEIIGLLSETSARPSGNTVFGGVLAMTLANWAPHVTNFITRDSRVTYPPYDPTSPMQALVWPVFAFVAVIMFAFISQSAQFNRPGGTMATISGTVLATAYIGLLGSFIIQFRWLPGVYHGVIPLGLLIATAKGADTGAYALGRIAGRHKLWPRLSPNKTVEGALGGLLAGVASALLVVAAGRYILRVHTLGWGATVGFGLVVSAAAQMGDLMESMIKRDCERKDASDMLPGLGGVLDVVDSLLFAGPVGFGFWLCYGP
jgi:phosphatidate cytidylyltransferase